MFIAFAIGLCLLLAGLVSIDFKTVVSRGSTVFASKTVTMESELLIELNIDPLSTGSSATKLASFLGDNLISMMFVSDQDITITVNDDGTPDLTIALLADTPYVYSGYGTNPLAGVTVSSIKFANASGSTANINGFIQHDAGA